MKHEHFQSAPLFFARQIILIFFRLIIQLLVEPKKLRSFMVTLRQHIPAWLKRFLRIVMYGFLDMWDKIADRREPMIPPRMTSLVVGSGDFKKIGKEFQSYLIHHAGLAPEHFLTYQDVIVARKISDPIMQILPNSEMGR